MTAPTVGSVPRACSLNCSSATFTRMLRIAYAGPPKIGWNDSVANVFVNRLRSARVLRRLPSSSMPLSYADVTSLP